MAAKEKWLHGDVSGARSTLESAFRANPQAESVWLAAAKLEAENGAMDRALELLANARAQAGTEKASRPTPSERNDQSLTRSPYALLQIWMKSAVLERQQGNLDVALKTLDEGIAKFPTFDKLYMIKGQIFQDRGEVAQARETYAKAVKVCSKSVPLWILASRLEEKAGVVIKARSLLEKARLVNPKEAELWEESVRVEERSGSAAQARAVLARGASSSVCLNCRPPLAHHSDLCFLLQVCKSARRRAGFGSSQSGTSRGRSARRRRPTRSSGRTTTRPSSSSSPASSGPTARSSAPGTGLAGRPTPTRTSATLGPGGSSLRWSTARKCVAAPLTAQLAAADCPV
jgi:predicted negative regulator of RcsB-dependent stress response